MYQLPSEFDPEVYKEVLENYHSHEDPHRWAIEYFASYIRHQSLYRWGSIPSVDYDITTKKSNLVEFAVRLNAVDIATMVHIVYGTAVMPFPFIFIMHFGLTKGADPGYIVKKISIYKSNESCVEIHGDPLVEVCYEDSTSYVEYAKVLLDWLDDVHGFRCEESIQHQE